MADFNSFFVSLLVTVIGFLLTYFFTKKPRLRFYYGAITQIPFPITNQSLDTDSSPSNARTQFGVIRSHTIVISNQGNSTAHNVRIGHFFLPAGHSVSPPLNIQNPQNPKEILIPTLCPREFFTISYLYPIENHFSEVNSYLKCDEGMAEIANIQDVRIKSSFLLWVMRSIFFVGAFTVIYFGIKFFSIFYKLYLISNP